MHMDEHEQDLSRKLLAEQAAHREAYVAGVEQARVAKAAKIRVGSRWAHRTNGALFGLIVRRGLTTREDKNPANGPRVWLWLKDTGEMYRCPPEQLVRDWECIEEAPGPEELTDEELTNGE